MRLTQKFSIWIYDSWKENSILHLLLSFIYFEDEFFLRKIFTLWNMISSAWTKFSLFFIFCHRSDPNPRSQFVTISKHNSILHLLLCFFHSEDGLLIRTIPILWKLNSSARMKFSLFFSFLRSWEPNSPSQLVTVWNRIQFCIFSFPSSTLRMNFL